MMSLIKKQLKKNLKHFLFFYSFLRYRIFVKVALNTSIGILDGFGLAMFFPLLQVMGDDPNATKEQMGNLSFLVDGLNRMGIELNLKNILVVLTGFFVLKGIATYVNDVYDTNVRAIFNRNVRTSMVEGLGKLSFKHFVTSDAGRIQNTTTSEVYRLSDAFAIYFQIFQNAIFVLVYVVLAFLVDVKLALMITLAGLLTNFLFTRIFRESKKISAKITDRSHIYQGLVIQFVANFKYLKASGVMGKLENLLIKSIGDIESDNKRMGKLHAIVSAAREPIMVVIIVVVIFSYLTFLDGAMAVIMVSLLFFYRALSALVQIQGFYNHFLVLSGSVENIINFDNELKINQEQTAEPPAQRNVGQFTNGITIERACFSYPGKEIIKDLSIDIKKNETIAFVGESGSGKTTLVNLISSLLPVDSGRISVDGIDMAVLDKQGFREKIGYIAQESVIFNDSIFNNITLWDTPSKSNTQRFWNAITQASLHDFVMDLSEQEHTLLGNNGINISGGQKQRISIARELYKQIDILILDEATSALDSETEQSIQQHVEKLKGSITIFIVAHRLSTIRNADRIVLMKNGRIVDINSFERLKASSTEFKKMVELQQF